MSAFLYDPTDLLIYPQAALQGEQGAPAMSAFLYAPNYNTKTL
jgi:hypothetical protein